MLCDGKKMLHDMEVPCDICIVGAGAAGITLALEMGQTGLNIVLLEAGGLKGSGKAQELYAGDVTNLDQHLPLDADRLRGLGGTTAIWGGRCIPFDAIDFQKRSYVPNSGWPISSADIEPYYRRAHTYCQCGEYTYRTDSLKHGQKDMIPGLPNDTVVMNSIERWSPPTHFGKTYLSALTKASNIQIFLHSICTEIEVSKTGDTVASLRINTLDGKKFRIIPKLVVLAGGGLEVTRLLLSSTSAFHPNGIGNHSNWLGAGYMCHLSGTVARVKFKENMDVIFGYEVDKDGVYCRRRLLISESAQRRNQILNLFMHLDRPLLGDPDHSNGLLSLTFLVKSISQRVHRQLPIKGKYALYWRHLRNILLGSPEILAVLPKWSRSRFIQGRRIPSLLLKPKNNTFYLNYHSEQIPNRNCRVSLGEARDQLGVPQLRVDFKVTQADVESVYRAHQLLDGVLRESGCGYLIYDSEDPKALIAKHRAVLGHHIGTTRMSQDPEDGVVDSHCRVHGMNNLFIASSSIFPTSSQANPTLTIVAMAIRLAEHLRSLQTPSKR